MLALWSRAWYVMAVLLILEAIAADLRYKYHVSERMMAVARATGVPAQRVVLHQVGNWHAQRSQFSAGIQFGLGAVAACFWLASRRRREPGPQSVLFVLFGFYAFLQIFLV
jgi:hypothetical protein